MNDMEEALKMTKALMLMYGALPDDLKELLHMVLRGPFHPGYNAAKLRYNSDRHAFFWFGQWVVIEGIWVTQEQPDGLPIPEPEVIPYPPGKRGEFR